MRRHFSVALVALLTLAGPLGLATAAGPPPTPAVQGPIDVPGIALTALGALSVPAAPIRSGTAITIEVPAVNRDAAVHRAVVTLHQGAPELGGRLLAAGELELPPAGVSVWRPTVTITGPQGFRNLVVDLQDRGAVGEGGAADGTGSRERKLAPVQRTTVSVRVLDTYDDVLVVVNDNSPDSVTIANYFIAKRSVPAANVVHIAAVTGETMTRAEFNAVRSVIENHLNTTGLRDTIRFIVTTTGIPIRVGSPTSSFDSELSLILGNLNSSIASNGPVDNPYYTKDEDFSHTTMGTYLVTRFIAYNLSEALRLVDLATNATPVRGRFVLDTDPSKTGGFVVGNTWMEDANTSLTNSGYDVFIDRNNTYLLGEQNVIGYASWGSNDCCDPGGANTSPRNGWLPGSLAETYVSTGGRTFTWPPSYGQSLIADWIAEGVTGMKGYVNEPFLDAIARPSYLFPRYVDGYTMAESYSMASVWIGWMDVTVGDPKIRPYFDRPDLRVDGLTAGNAEAGVPDPAQIAYDENVTLTATVSNRGAIDAGPFTVRFYDGLPSWNRIIGNATSAGLAVDGSVNVTASWRASTSGSVDIYAVVIPGQPEIRQANNQRMLSVQVLDPPALAVTIVGGNSTAYVRQGATVALNLKAANTGQADGTFDAVLRVEGTNLSDQVASRSGALAGFTDDLWTWDVDTSPFAGDVCFVAELVPLRREIAGGAADNVASRCTRVTVYGFSLVLDPASVTVPPWGTARTEIQLTNLGNMGDTYIPLATPMSAGWDTTFEGISLDVPAGATGVMTVIVTGVLGIPAGVPGTIDLRFTSQTTGEFRTAVLTATAERVPSLICRTSPAGGPLAPGAWTTLSLGVENLGNADENVSLVGLLPPGVTITGIPDHLAVRQGSVEFVTLTVTAAADAPPFEDEPIVLVARVPGDETGCATGITIPRVVRFDVDLPLDRLTVAPSPFVAPGGTDSLAVRTENSGNVDGTIRVTATPAGGSTGLTVTVAPASDIDLDPLRNGTWAITVAASFRAREGAHQVEVRVARVVGSQVETLEVALITVQVAQPQLELRVDLTPGPSRVVEGTIVGIRGNVTNTGKATVVAASVVVTDNRNLIGSVLLGDLVPGETASFTLPWSPTPGAHPLRVGVDDGTGRDASVYPKGVFTSTITVVRGLGPTSPIATPLATLAAIVAGGIGLFAAALIGVMLLARRKRRMARADQPPLPPGGPPATQPPSSAPPSPLPTPLPPAMSPAGPEPPLPPTPPPDADGTVGQPPPLQ